MLRKIQRIYGKVPEREYAAGDLKKYFSLLPVQKKWGHDF